MNYKIKFLVVLSILQFSKFHNAIVNAQTLSPQVIASTGGYQASAVGSLSFTIGETNIQTLSSATHILTQGFQQPFDLNLLNVKAFLQGYYIGSGMMQDVLYNQGEYLNPSLTTDSITVELHEVTSPYTIAFQTQTIIKQNGNIHLKGFGVVGQSYFIVLKHRNGIETWSANPILLSNNTNYDFSSAATQAYGNNQFEIEPNVWAIYSGDINQDGAIDAFDYLIQEPDIINGNSGYLNTDLNGDGAVDAYDYLVMDPNMTAGIGVVIP